MVPGVVLSLCRVSVSTCYLLSRYSVFGSLSVEQVLDVVECFGVCGRVAEEQFCVDTVEGVQLVVLRHFADCLPDVACFMPVVVWGAVDVDSMQVLPPFGSLLRRSDCSDYGTNRVSSLLHVVCDGY